MSFVTDEFKEIKCPHCKVKVMLLLQFDINGRLKWVDVDTDNVYKIYGEEARMFK